MVPLAALATGARIRALASLDLTERLGNGWTARAVVALPPRIADPVAWALAQGLSPGEPGQIRLNADRGTSPGRPQRTWPVVIECIRPVAPGLALTLVDPVAAVRAVPVTALFGAEPLDRSVADALRVARCQGLAASEPVSICGRARVPTPPVLAAAGLALGDWLDQVLCVLSLRVELAGTPAGLEVRLADRQSVEPDLPVEGACLAIEDVRARAPAPPRPHLASSTRDGSLWWIGAPGAPARLHREAGPDEAWTRRQATLGAELGQALELRATGHLPDAAMGTVLRLAGTGVLGRTRWRCTRVTHRIRGEHCRTDLTATDAANSWLPSPVRSIEPIVVEGQIEGPPSGAGLVPVQLPGAERAPVSVPAWDDGAGSGHGATAPRGAGDRVLLLVADPTSVEIMGALPPSNERPSPPGSGWQVDDPAAGAWSGVRLRPAANARSDAAGSGSARQRGQTRQLGPNGPNVHRWAS